MTDEILQYAMRVLARQDCSEARLRRKLTQKFQDYPEEVIATLKAKRFLDDRRFAENYVTRRINKGPNRLRQELLARGISEELAESAVRAADLPSLRDAAKATMIHWKLRAPLQPRDAARLFRALVRLGYEEDAIREEIEQLHEQ